jgi:adenine-specific DNA-methyltransferase
VKPPYGVKQLLLYFPQASRSRKLRRDSCCHNLNGYGRGVFLHALAEAGVQPHRITAFDLDPERSPSDVLAKTYRSTDFIAWALRTHNRFDRIIGNPPYVALRRLPPVLRDVALSVPGPEGKPIGVGSNYWHAFFCVSLRLLRPGGGVSFILPAAWDFATYAAALRNHVQRHFSRIEIHRTHKPIFTGVQDGCIIILADGYGRANDTSLRFEHSTLEALVSTLQNHRGKSAQSVPHQRLVRSASTKDVHVSDILEIHLGGVTGDADFFLLTETERRARELPMVCLRPVLSKARHLVSAEIGKPVWDELRRTNERVWLFYPSSHVLGHPAVQRYLQLDAACGGCRRERYKIKKREPWYQTPLPHQVDGFISGMSRFGPWLSLNNMARLTATNTLYTVQFRKPQTLEQKAAWGLSLLTSYTQQAMKPLSRVYADGLVKYEPGDLLSLPLHVPRGVRGARTFYTKAVKLLLQGNRREAQEIADVFMCTAAN